MGDIEALRGVWNIVPTPFAQDGSLDPGSLPGLAEEAPAAYKDVDAVVDAVVGAGIARKVARLRPVAVVKG